MFFKQLYTSILLSLPIGMASLKLLKKKRPKHENDSSNFTIHLCLKNTWHTGHLNRKVQPQNQLG